MNNQPVNPILLSGASGLVGTALLRALAQDGISTLRLVRGRPDNADAVPWNPYGTNDLSGSSRLEGHAAVIHLSGANLAGRRWTGNYEREIVESRVRTTHTLVDLLRSLRNPPRTFLCASATGIYGNRGDEILTESASPGHGFLADTCCAWEAEAARAADLGIRVVHLRFGVVLSREGGGLQRMLPVFRSGFAGCLGSGRQWMSWMTIDDVVRAVRHILQTGSLHGPVNLVTPTPVTNADFTRALAHALRRPAVLPVPRFALRLAFGDMAEEALLSSVRALPERLAASGFQFNHPEINAALRAIL